MKTKKKLITGSNFRDFDWNKAKFFYHIVKAGSFLKAAEVLGTDQPSLTRQIQVLEVQVGCPLLIRKPGGVQLTRKGEELLKMITPFFLKAKGFCGNTYVEVGEEKRRKVRIATTHAVASYVISDLILDYAKKNPHISFELIGDDCVMDIILNDVDIAIQPLDLKDTSKKTEGLQYEYLFSLESKLYASSHYIDSYGEPKTVGDLINHRMVNFPQSEKNPYHRSVNWVLSLGMPEGKLHNPVYVSNSLESLIDAAEKGIGIVGLYEEYKVTKHSGLKNILPEIKDKPIKEYFVYPDYLKEDEVIMDIKNYLMEKLSS
jgi:DNA-binding transcriptional LysR family regulator